MIVFVEIKTISDEPLCAFFNTVNDRFEENEFGTHVFDSFEDIETHSQANRLRGLVPPGFFGQVSFYDAVKLLSRGKMRVVAGGRDVEWSINDRIHAEGFGDEPIGVVVYVDGKETFFTGREARELLKCGVFPSSPTTVPQGKEVKNTDEK